jgi:flagellar biosynthesis/type III secretory pathway protein FliH
LCRGELIEGQGVAQDQEADEIFSHERMMSMFDGDELDPADPHYQFNLSDQDYENAVNGSFAAAHLHQRGYAEGIEDGRREAEEEFLPRMREEIDIATQKAYDDGVVQGRSLASEEIRLLREENQRLKQRNSRMREDIQFHTQRFYSPSI